MKRKMSALLNIREMQTKIHQGITIEWSEWPLAETLQRINTGDNMEKKEPSHTDAGNANCEQPLWRTE